tara:strand:+ start:888 stop:1793 length:906 start_codon:yes stop_codon:yes gene_type:complete
MTKDLIYIINELTDRGLVKESNYLYSVFKKVAYKTTERAEQLFNMANPNKNNNKNERLVAAKNLYKLLNDINKPEFGYKELARMILGKKEQETFDSEDFLGGVLTGEETSILRRLSSPVSDRSNNNQGFPHPDFVDQYGDYDTGPPRPGDPEWEAYAERERRQAAWAENLAREREERWRSGTQTPRDEEIRDAWIKQHKEYARQRESARRAYESNSDRIQNRWKIMAVLDNLKDTATTVTIKLKDELSDAIVVDAVGETARFAIPTSGTKLSYKVLSINELLEDDFIKLNPDHFKRQKWEF